MSDLKKEVLILTKTDPSAPRDGGSIRVNQIIAALTSRGWNVRAISVEASRKRSAKISVKLIPLVIRVLLRYLRSGSPSSLRWFSPRVVGESHAAIRNGKPDLLLIEYSQLYPYRLIWDGPVAIDLHNIESELMLNYARSARGPRKLAAQVDARALRRLESRIARDRIPTFVVSDHDRTVLQGLAPETGAEILTVPNGVDAAFFEIGGERDNPAVFVFIAHLGWRPNIDAAKWLTEEVWPHVLELLPTAELKLIGRSPSPDVNNLATHTGVEVHANVDSTAPFLVRATAATAPLLSAGGTRLKILESLGAGTPVIATPLGALGLEHLASDPRVMRIAADPQEFARSMVAYAQTLSERAHLRTAVANYQWRSALIPLIKRLDLAADADGRDADS